MEFNNRDRNHVLYAINESRLWDLVSETLYLNEVAFERQQWGADRIVHLHERIVPEAVAESSGPCTQLLKGNHIHSVFPFRGAKGSLDAARGLAEPTGQLPVARNDQLHIPAGTASLP